MTSNQRQGDTDTSLLHCSVLKNELTCLDSNGTMQLKFFKMLVTQNSPSEIIKYFLSELCMAAFLDPETDGLSDKVLFQITSLLNKWINIAVVPILDNSRYADPKINIFY